VPDARTRRRIVSVSSSSKKSGKSTVAAYLVRELRADYGLKVSSGSHSATGIVTDTRIISRKGTDTGSLVRAGAKLVIWVNSPQGQLSSDIRQALELFPAGGLLVVEGNSALTHLTPDFAVFVMTVPFEDFKPSAVQAIKRADLVLVDKRSAVVGRDIKAIEAEINERAPEASVLFFGDDGSLAESLPRVADMAKALLA
jgi:molybdopterin-guanine dinucleotide biosynthesis protein